MSTTSYKNLPAIIFLYGPSGSGRRELASALSFHLGGLRHITFRTPLRDTARATFFEANPTISIEKNKPLPIAHTDTIEGFMKEYQGWLRKRYGHNILGYLSFLNHEEDLNWFNKFVIEDVDTDTEGDAQFWIDECGIENCLLVFVSRGTAYSMENSPFPPDTPFIHFDNHPREEKALVNDFLEALSGNDLGLAHLTIVTVN